MPKRESEHHRQRFEPDALRLLETMHRLRKNQGLRTTAVVWAKKHGSWPARFVAMPLREIERIKYVYAEPWRLVGVYLDDVPISHLTDDLSAWTREHGKMVA